MMSSRRHDGEENGGRSERTREGHGGDPSAEQAQPLVAAVADWPHKTSLSPALNLVFDLSTTLEL